MKKRFQGRVWKFGDHIDTDVITPGKYENLPLEELCRHCLEPIKAAFAHTLKDNDVLVAGVNFGCGSAREIAPRALKQLKIGAVVAKSFSRTFFRNAIAIGLPVLISPQAFEACHEGDRVMIDLAHSRLKNMTTKKAVPVDPIPKDIYGILLSGGLFASLRKKRRLKPKARSRSAAVPMGTQSKRIQRQGGRG
jgi:3-isopropylmalate/(R)-2-methylmalate dehydratase small subunit